RTAMRREAAERLLEISGTQLGPSARARRVAGERDFLSGCGIGQLGVHRHDSAAVIYDPYWTSSDSGLQATSASRKTRKASARGERLRSRCVARWNERVTLRSFTRRQARRPLRHSSSTARLDISETPTPALTACLMACVEPISPTMRN